MEEVEEEEDEAVAATSSLAMRGRMNFVTRLTPPRTELTRTSTGDKAQEKRTGLAEGAGRDEEAGAGVVMSPLHARTAPAGHAWKWRDSPYNCRALTATVRNSLRRAEESTVVAPS